MNQERAVKEQTQETNSMEQIQSNEVPAYEANLQEAETSNTRSQTQRPRSETMALFSEFVEFLGERKKYWLLPIVVVMVLLGALIVFTSSSAIAPFIYTVF